MCKLNFLHSKSLLTPVPYKQGYWFLHAFTSIMRITYMKDPLKKIGTVKAKWSLLYFTAEKGGHLWCYTSRASIATDIRWPADEMKTRWCLSAVVQIPRSYLQFPRGPSTITKAVWVEGWQPGNHTPLALLFSWPHSTLLWHLSSLFPPLRVHQTSTWNNYITK